MKSVHKVDRHVVAVVVDDGVAVRDAVGQSDGVDRGTAVEEVRDVVVRGVVDRGVEVRGVVDRGGVDRDEVDREDLKFTQLYHIWKLPTKKSKLTVWWHNGNNNKIKV